MLLSVFSRLKLDAGGLYNLRSVPYPTVVTLQLPGMSYYYSIFLLFLLKLFAWDMPNICERPPLAMANSLRLFGDLVSKEFC